MLHIGRQAGPTVSVYMCEFDGKSPKQGSKRFHSQGRRNTVPIGVYNLSMAVGIFFRFQVNFVCLCCTFLRFS